MGLSGVLSAAQARAESLMTDVCIITRADADPVLDEETGQYPTGGTTLYSGKCRVRSGRSMGADRDAGDQFAIVNRATISVPVGESGFATGDLVTITAAPHNPQLVNARYRVMSIGDQSQPSALRLECEEA